MDQLTQEQLTPTVDLVTELRDGRLRLAQEESATKMQRLLSVDRINKPDTTIDISRAGSRLSSEVVTVEDLIALESMGADVNDILRKTGDESDLDEGETYAVFEAGKETVSLSKYRQGLELKLDIEGVDLISENRGSVEIMEGVRRRFSQSPGHMQLKEMAKRFEGGASSISSEWFNPRDDELGSLLFLQDIGLCSVVRAADQLREGRGMEEVMDFYLENVPDYVATTEETDAETIYTWGNGVKQYLVVDKASGSWRYALREHSEDNYPEKANQMAVAEEIPFIDTECAKQMLEWMGEEGIMFAPAIQREIMRVGEAERYGSIYTQISREIAKTINRPERSLSGLFVAMDPDFHGSKLLDSDPHSYEDKVYTEGLSDQDEVLERLRNVDLDRFSPAARNIMSLVKQSLSREILQTDLPVTKEDISVKDGACFDVLAYYMGAADGWNNDLKKVNINGTDMLEKLHGRHTFLLIDETMFNGVILPKGSLMSRAEDGGWAFLRLTAFSLETEQDQKAAGSEIAKVLHNEERLVARLGGFSLSAMQKRLIERRYVV